MVTSYTPSDSFNKKRNAELSKAIFGNHPALGATALKSPIQPAKTQPFDLGTAYENNQKMQYRQQGIDSLKPPEPFKMDLASIQSDPTYQAAMQSAKEATQIAEGDISAAMNRRGIMDSSITASTAANAAQREYGRVNRELLPQLIQDQYKRYVDNADRNRQYAKDLFGVSDLYANDEQTAFNNAITESGVTGNYINPELDFLINQVIKNKEQAQVKGLPNADVKAISALTDQYRNRIGELGYDASLFGADVTAEQARANKAKLGKTIDAQKLDFDIMDRNRNYDQEVFEDERDFKYLQEQDKLAQENFIKEFNNLLEQQDFERALQLAQQRVNESREARISSGGTRSSGSGGSGGGGSSNEYTGGVITDVNQPRTAATMETWIINNIPGGNKVAGPPNPNQLEWIETQILNNPNLSEKDMIKLYNRFGIPLPE